MELLTPTRTTYGFTFFVLAALAATAGCSAKDSVSGKISPGVSIEQVALIPLQGETARAITSAPARVIKGAGLAGVMGGARVKVLQAGMHEILLPLPQLTAGQVPVCYSITTTPSDAA